MVSPVDPFDSAADFQIGRLTSNALSTLTLPPDATIVHPTATHANNLVLVLIFFPFLNSFTNF